MVWHPQQERQENLNLLQVWVKKKDGTWGWGTRRKTTFHCMEERESLQVNRMSSQPTSSDLREDNLALAEPGLLQEEGWCTDIRPLSTQGLQAVADIGTGEFSTYMTHRLKTVAGIYENGGSGSLRGREIKRCEVGSGDSSGPVTSYQLDQEVTKE